MTTYEDVLISAGDVTKAAIELVENRATVQIKHTDIDEAAEIHVLGSVDDVEYSHIPDFKGEPMIMTIKGTGTRLFPILGLDGVPYLKVAVVVKDAKAGTINFIKVL